MDNHAVDGMLFKRIKDATLPKEVWIAGVQPLRGNDIKESNKKADNDIYQLFDHLNYLTDK